MDRGGDRGDELAAAGRRLEELRAAAERLRAEVERATTQHHTAVEAGRVQRDLARRAVSRSSQRARHQAEVDRETAHTARRMAQEEPGV